MPSTIARAAQTLPVAAPFRFGRRGRMRGATTVNDEFEVGFNQRFESHWYWAEISGRVVRLIFVGCALFGLLGRGTYSPAHRRTTDGVLAVDYEPISRHSTATTITAYIH